jgi:hypothetical protein
MDDTRGIVKFARPANYDSVIRYAETPKKNFADLRKYRPQNITIIRQALNDYLKQCLFENCIPNKGYIKALGFSADTQVDKNKNLQPGDDVTSK